MSHVDHSASDAEAAVRGLVEDWANAVRRRNMPAILRNHSSDILMFDVPAPFQSNGIEAYRKTWELFFSSAPDPTIFDVLEMHVTAGRDVAFVAAVLRCADREADGKNVELDFRLTIGLRNVDGQWVVTHEHHSVPATS
jgi:uncharacterized protein (TIGR02246 family)